MTPELSSARIFLTPLTRVHQHHVDWLNDSEVTRYSEQRHQRHTRASVEHYLKTLANNKSHIWAIFDEDIMHIGNITADIDCNNRIADLGILIGNKKVWGKGYGTTAWLMVLNWLLYESGLYKAEAGCMANNAAMLKIFKHSLMQYEGRRIKHFQFNENERVDAVYYGISK